MTTAIERKLIAAENFLVGAVSAMVDDDEERLRISIDRALAYVRRAQVSARLREKYALRLRHRRPRS